MPPACAGRAQGTRTQPEQPALTDVAAPNRGITHTCTHLPPAGGWGPLRTPAHTYHLQDPGTPAYTCTHTTCTSQWTPCAHLHTHHLYEPMDTCAHLQICSHVRGHTRLHTAAHTPEPALRLVRPPVSCVPGHSDLSLHLLLQTCGLFPETAPTAVRPERPLWHTQGLGRCLSHSQGGHGCHPKR